MNYQIITIAILSGTLILATLHILWQNKEISILREPVKIKKPLTGEERRQKSMDDILKNNTHLNCKIISSRKTYVEIVGIEPMRRFVYLPHPYCSDEIIYITDHNCKVYRTIHLLRDENWDVVIRVIEDTIRQISVLRHAEGK